MNSFKKMLKINSKRNTDEVIYSKFTLEMSKMCQKLEKEENKENENQIKQIKNRIKGLTDIFIDYEGNMEIIENYELGKNIIQPNNKTENNEIDKKLQRIIRNSGNEIYKRIIGEAEKIQVLDRMVGTIKLLGNFDEYMEELQRSRVEKQKNQERELA